MATFQVAKVKREKRPEPFSVELSDGSEVTFADPKKLHWTVLTELDNLPPAKQIEVLAVDGFDKFRDDPEMDGEMLELVMADWRRHYGLGDAPAAGSVTAGS